MAGHARVPSSLIGCLRCAVYVPLFFSAGHSLQDKFNLNALDFYCPPTLYNPPNEGNDGGARSDDEPNLPLCTLTAS
ncbi:hypothetical protein DdX_19851 [Ditylenchus destructor]|uniref:Uncharacterized protein n=1 Tax=Ditylenchus destructor TaxID=166010 RepID=A0AAD4MH93_9BILA|nr:hypothetical protein DdX_19851 [Ditylenchus destructor]